MDYFKLGETLGLGVVLAALYPVRSLFGIGETQKQSIFIPEPCTFKNAVQSILDKFCHGEFGMDWFDFGILILIAIGFYTFLKTIKERIPIKKRPDVIVDIKNKCLRKISSCRSLFSRPSQECLLLSDTDVSEKSIKI